MPPANSEKKEPKPYNPLKTPKQRFQEYSQWIGEHRQMVDSIAFQRGLDYAMLQYQQQIAGSVTDSAGAGAAGLRLQGMVEFVNTLKNLSESSAAPVKRPDDNLKH